MHQVISAIDLEDFWTNGRGETNWVEVHKNLQPFLYSQIHRVLHLLYMEIPFQTSSVKVGCDTWTNLSQQVITKPVPKDQELIWPNSQLAGYAGFESCWPGYQFYFIFCGVCVWGRLGGGGVGGGGEEGRAFVTLAQW